MNLFENLQTLKESEHDKKYAVDFRNMHNAIHGLIIFDNEQEALTCAKHLNETEDGEFLEFYDYVDFIEEINYRNIKDTEHGKFYDDIKIVNNICVDLYNI
jgi:hypothetical protein